ncbi:MAG: hypothetical protein WBG37_15080 [Desulfobacterales bacterium]
MTAYILKTAAGLIVLLTLAAGVYFQAQIQKHYPGFDPTLWATGAVFFGGMTYAVMERNIIIVFIVLVATVAVPFLKQWAVAYWPY